METAIATPAILPKPTVAESAAVSAWKCVTSPSWPSIAMVSMASPPGVESPAPIKDSWWSISSYFPLTILIDVKKPLKFIKLK